MNDTRVARRYAQALYGAASAADAVSATETDLASIIHSLKNDDRFADFLDAPYRSGEDKQLLLTNVYSDRMTNLTLQMLRIMVDKGREGELENVYNEYVRLRRAEHNVVLAIVTSAVPLPEDQQKALIAKLTQQLNSTVETEFRVDPAIIGGVRVAYGDYVLDGSIRGSLNKLRERLRHDVLKQA